jgi:hypothetical protein
VGLLVEFVQLRVGESVDSFVTGFEVDQEDPVLYFRQDELRDIPCGLVGRSGDPYGGLWA